MDVLEHVPDIETRLPALLGPVVRVLDKDPTHIHKWPRQRWLELAAQNLTDLSWHGLFRYLIPGGKYVHCSSRRLRGIAPAIFITGRAIPPLDES
jgi:hypothetical protein